MQIHVNTDNHIAGSAKLTQEVENIVKNSLDHFGDRITRVNVHFSDENSSQKFGDNDKRCVIEARLGGLQPITARHQGSSLDQALDGAADKLEKSLKRTLRRKGSIFKRRIRARVKLTAVDPQLQRDAETEKQEEFIRVLSPFLGRLGNHARRELRIMEANGMLYPGKVIFADLLDEMVIRAWSQYADRPQWISLDLWLTKLLDETLEKWTKEDPRIHGALHDRTGEVPPQSVPQLDDQEWWAWLLGLLGEDEPATQDDVPDRQSSAWAEEYLEAEELLFRIHGLLGELPKAQRQAFMLHVLESYDLSEIASLQRRSEGEVRTDIEAARDMFVERLRAGAKLHPSTDCAVGGGVLATGTAEEA